MGDEKEDAGKRRLVTSKAAHAVRFRTCGVQVAAAGNCDSRLGRVSLVLLRQHMQRDAAGTHAARCRRHPCSVTSQAPRVREQHHPAHSGRDTGSAMAMRKS